MRRRYIGWALGLAVLLPGVASATTITFAMDTEFSGATQPSGIPTVTITDTAANTVLVTVTSNLSGSEFVDDLYLNIDPSVSLLTFSGLTGTGANAVNSFGYQANTFKAAGDGFFDFVLDFAPPGPERFGAGESVSFTLSATGLDATDFVSLSHCAAGCGTSTGFYTAVHVQGIGPTADLSGWLGSTTLLAPLPSAPLTVPEPTTLLLLGSGVAVARLRRRR